MHATKDHLMQAFIHLGRLTHNIGLLQEMMADRPLSLAIKANAYGHGAESLSRVLCGSWTRSRINWSRHRRSPPV
jgi:alanine racemase